MLASVLPLDLSPLLQFVFTALFLGLGLLHIVKTTASRCFVVDARFDGGAGGADDRQIPAGGAFSDNPPMAAGGGDACFVCGSSGNKKCSRCKAIRYCSTTCQTKHWKEGHKLKCKEFKLLDKVDSLPSPTSSSSSGRRKVSLVPARGTCKVLQQAKKVLFPYDEFVKLFNWDTSGFPPCGLLNCGNSCFANVVLQCLACTRPLVAFLLDKEHSRKCNRNDWCFLCELQCHIRRVCQSAHPFSPINILSRLPNIGGNLGYGKQEDAHEFMRFVIDTMQSICLDEFGGEKALDPSTQETTLIQHMFGGHLQSQVICTKCDKISFRYENMMDLTVEIQGDVASLEDCLDQFTVKEWLDGENMYKCDGCNDYVKAWKRLTIHQAPNILTIALKRFQSGRFGKLNKRVAFPETLDLGPYMSEAGDGNDVYKLYAVVVHVDMLNASFFGHYICYTKDFSGNWYRIDDCKVMKVDVDEVLAQGAYMLLYNRICARQPRVKSLEHSRKAEGKSVEVAKEVQGSRELVESFGIALSTDSIDSGYEREMSTKVDSNTLQEESEFLNLVDLVKVASNHTREDPNAAGLCYPGSSSSGSKDLDKSSLAHCSHVVEDVPSVELTNGEPANSNSSIELSIRAAAVDCQEPGTSSIDCQCKEENGTWNNQDKEFQLVESSLDDSITNVMTETSGVSIAAVNSALRSPVEATLTFVSSYSEPRSEQVVISCYPTISGSGLGNSNCNGFAESYSAQNCSKINGHDVSLETFSEKCEDLTDSGNLLTSTGCLDKASRKSSNEDDAARKEPGVVDLACNGCADPLFPDENGIRVPSHDLRVTTFCRNCEDMSLDIEKPLSYDENVKNPAEVIHACKLDTNCNGFVDSLFADQTTDIIYEQEDNGNDVILDCKDPLDSSHLLQSARKNFHEKSDVARKPKDSVEVGGNASDLVDHNGNGEKIYDNGLSPLCQNDMDVHLNCEVQRQETV